MRPTKQVIVVRKDLNMRKGKMIAQGAHASTTVFFKRMITSGSMFVEECDKILPLTEAMMQWLQSGQTKICVSVDSEKELLETFNAAKAAGLPCSLIKDAGHTEFKEPTFTAVAIGPDYADKIDSITGDKKLL